jgi:hypothetical protein
MGESPASADFANDEDWHMPNGGLVILNFIDLIEENG